jgi:hypothetical protein
MVLIGIGLAVALILTSRQLGSLWTLIYKLAIGAIAGGVCYFVLQKVDTSDEIKWVSSFVVGLFVSIAASGIPWR